MELEGQADLMRQLERIISDMGSGYVEIGFFGGNYPDGGPSVPTVAFWNEFGIPSNSQPPRPFFRNMIAQNQDSWINLAASAAQISGGNGNQALHLMGEEIRAQLQESIRTFTDPDIKETTKRAKGFDTPLQDTKIMVNSVTYRVNE